VHMEACSRSAMSQKRHPIWFPHCPTCTVTSSRGMAIGGKKKENRDPRGPAGRGARALALRPGLVTEY